MANQDNQGIEDADQLSGRDRQPWQGAGGIQIGGGPSQSDVAAPSGSSGSGGYGNAQNQADQQQAQTGYGSGQDIGQSRGEAFDEQQGGGRGMAGISQDGGLDPAEDRELDRQADALLQDQQHHQERGQSSFEDEE